jgi:hypothetical protein
MLQSGPAFMVPKDGTSKFATSAHLDQLIAVPDKQAAGLHIIW